MVSFSKSSVSVGVDLKTLPNIDALRNYTPRGLRSGASVILSGQITPGDANGGVYIWSDASTSADDGYTVVKPNAGFSAGRWLLSIGKGNGSVGPQGPSGPVGPQGDGIASVMAPNGSALVGFKSRTVADKLAENLSARDFGAIGDGGLHRLSERFPTLAAAQAVYPFATSLQQSLDWAGIQSVLNMARDSGPTNRRVVAYLPNGRYVLTDSLRMASNVWFKGDLGSTYLDNQNFPLGVAQLTNDDPIAFQYTHITGIGFNGGRHGILIDASTTEGNMLEDCSFALQSSSNYQCERLYQTSTMSRCLFQLAPYGVVLPGDYTNQNSWYSCEFNNHTEGSIRVTFSGEGLFFYNCRMEAGGKVGKATITLNNVRCFHWIGGYIEGTHTYVLSETRSTDTTSFSNTHFTGSSDGVGGFAPYQFQSDGIVTIQNSHGYFPIKAALNTILLGSNPQVVGTKDANIWRHKDIMGGDVKLRQRNPRTEPTHSLLRFSQAASGGVHGMTGTLRLQFYGLDSSNGINRKAMRTFQVSADNYDGTMKVYLKTIATVDDQIGPVTITLQQKAGSSTATSVDLEVVYANVFAAQALDSYSLVSLAYECVNSDEANPLIVTAL